MGDRGQVCNPMPGVGIMVAGVVGLIVVSEVTALVPPGQVAGMERQAARLFVGFATAISGGMLMRALSVVTGERAFALEGP